MGVHSSTTWGVLKSSSILLEGGAVGRGAEVTVQCQTRKLVITNEREASYGCPTNRVDVVARLDPEPSVWTNKLVDKYHLLQVTVTVKPTDCSQRTTQTDLFTIGDVCCDPGDRFSFVSTHS
jgi:hypothetical protein